ncbi:unnamed protein product [Rhizophagus irregularis]|nr:unnamed protein product [Rhizophagus irregularis]
MALSILITNGPDKMKEGASILNGRFKGHREYFSDVDAFQYKSDEDNHSLCVSVSRLSMDTILRHHWWL